jgi:hypothetical protein
MLHEEKFDDMIFIDETTVELRNIGLNSWQKNEKNKFTVSKNKKCKFKHNIKVFIWFHFLLMKLNSNLKFYNQNRCMFSLAFHEKDQQIFQFSLES